MTIRHKQVNYAKKKKSCYNAVYISFSVYNIDVNIHYVDALSSVMVLT